MVISRLCKTLCNCRGERQTKSIITKTGENCAKACRGQTINKYEIKCLVGVHGNNQRLVDLVDLQGRFVDADKKKKHSPSIQAAFLRAIAQIIPNGLFKVLDRTASILKRYVDREPTQKAKEAAKKDVKEVEKKKGKKAQVGESESEHEDEDIICVGIDKTLTKDESDSDDGPKGSGRVVFNSITAMACWILGG